MCKQRRRRRTMFSDQRERMGLSSVGTHPGQIDYRSCTAIGLNEWNFMCGIAESFYVAYNDEWSFHRVLRKFPLLIIMATEGSSQSPSTRMFGYVIGYVLPCISVQAITQECSNRFGNIWVHKRIKFGFPFKDRWTIFCNPRSSSLFV